MGLIDKMKNIFTEDEEVIKSEVTQVEIPAPIKKEEPINETIEEVKKTNTPIFFDDEYFKELEKPKEIKSSYLKDNYKKETKETKIFKPTPIISPVYGVLDKNYNKEDITTKQERKAYSNSKTIDEVRKKAYGTLEDELENTLFGNNSILFNEEAKDDLFEELASEDVEVIDDVNIVEEQLDNINESELFDLIDSMYEKGE